MTDQLADAIDKEPDPYCDFAGTLHPRNCTCDAYEVR